MPVSITIEPLTPSIDMYDSPDTSSAYSLSGHITIAASSSSSIFGLSRSSAHNLTLSSLELTFEGQSELIIKDIGYAPLRIISITEQLVSPSHPVQITANEDCAEWRVVFNLTIPGWLPATAFFNEDSERHVADITYGLYACARFHPVGAPVGADVDDTQPSAVPGTTTSSKWNNLCSVVRFRAGRPRVVQAEKVPIYVTRYVSPPNRAYSGGDSLLPFPRSTFAVEALSECASNQSPSTNIPLEILRSVELHSVVPRRTSIEDDSVPLLLRLRCRSDDEASTRLRVLGFEANIIQVEEFHTSPSHKYTSRFPLPPFAQQPPQQPLRSTHPVGTLFNLGLITLPPQSEPIVNERSIVPDGKSKHFKVRGAEGTGDAGVPIEKGWLRMEVDVPVSPGPQEANEKEKGKRVAGTSPFLDVKHEMRVRLTVGYEQTGKNGEIAMVSDELAFMVPLEFVLVTPTTVSPFASAFFPVLAHMHQDSTSFPLPHPPMTSNHSPTNSLSRSHSPSSLPSTDLSYPSTHTPLLHPLPVPPPLPAYSQLFHENGDLKDDIHIALPLYREKEEEDAQSYSHSSSPSPALQQPHLDPPASASSSSTMSSSSPSPHHLRRATSASSSIAPHPHRALLASSSSTKPHSRPSPKQPHRALSLSSNCTRSSSSLSISAASSFEHIGAEGLFMSRLSIGVLPPPPPRLPLSGSLPESPIFPERPLTTSGLEECPAPVQRKKQGRKKNMESTQGKAKEKKPKNLFVESFLGFDGHDEDRELIRLRGQEQQTEADEHVLDNQDTDSARGEVLHGIAL